MARFKSSPLGYKLSKDNAPVAVPSFDVVIVPVCSAAYSTLGRFTAAHCPEALKRYSMCL